MQVGMIAALPDLVSLRATTGVFYDVIGGGGEVTNEIGERFETYCRELLEEMLPGYNIRPSFKYALKKGDEVSSPDIFLCSNSNAISAIFECKATRMSYEARFSENPVADARRAYEDIAKGVFQIWKFASHHRRGLIPNEEITPGAKGVVLTLDTWMAAASDLREDVFALARARADKDPAINDTDRIPVTFCSVEDLEQVLNVASEESFCRTLDAAMEAQFQGWLLWSIHQKIAPDINLAKGYPFGKRIAEVLPWWNKFTTRQ